MTTRPWKWLMMLGVVLLWAVMPGGCTTSEQNYASLDYAARNPSVPTELWIVSATAPSKAASQPSGATPGRGGGGGAVMAAATTATPTIVPSSPMLAARQPNGQLAPLPLQHTAVDAVISGYVASVGVTQHFANASAQRIDAVYVFPLPENAGVSAFTMTIGQRHIRGIIRERTEAQRIYQQARAQGYVATLMTQEGSNLFTQSVANIEPGHAIDIAIRYFHTLAYTDGWFEWRFPMAVGSPAGPAGASAAGRGRAPRTDNGPYARPDQRSGHDIDLRVQVDAGMEVSQFLSVNHPIAQSAGPNQSTIIQLAPADSLANKDFVLRYKVAGEKVKAGLFVQRDKEGNGGWFTLLLVPPGDAPNQARTGTALLADVQLQFGTTSVSDVYPGHIPELLSNRPVVIAGRFSGAPPGPVTITGRTGGQLITYNVSAAASLEENPAIATLWARARLSALHDQAVSAQRDVRADIKATALTYGIVSEYTNFIAVDTTQRTEGDSP